MQYTVESCYNLVNISYVKFILNCPWLLNPSLNVLKFNLVSENLILSVYSFTNF